MAESSENLPVNRLAKLAKSRKHDELEAAWMAALEEEAGSTAMDSPQRADMLEALKILAQHGAADLLESLLWYWVTNTREKAGANAALSLLRMTATLLPDSSVLREELAAICHLLADGEGMELAELAARAALRKGLSLASAASITEKLLALRPGEYVLDERTQRAGRIESADIGREAVRVSFGEEESYCDLSVIPHLQPLPQDDFRALKVFELDRLRAMAEQMPEELVRLVLQTFEGRLSFRDLRSHLSEVIGKGNWARWWNNVKPRLKLSPVIQMTDEAQPDLVLRRQAVSYAEQMRARFRGASSLEEKCLVALESLHHLERAGGDEPGLLEFFGSELKREAMERKADPFFLGALAVVSEIGTRLAGSEGTIPPSAEVSCAIRERVADGARLQELLAPIQDDLLMECVLGCLRRTFPDQWPNLWAEAMLVASRGVCDTIARELMAGGFHETLWKSVESVLKRSARHVGALLWIWRVVCAGRLSGSVPEMDRVGILLRLLSAADMAKSHPEAYRPGEAKRLLAEIRSALAFKNFELVRDVVAHADRLQAAQILEALKRDLALSDQARETISGILVEHHPRLFAEKLPPWEEDVIYTTKAGLEKVQQEFEHLTKVKIPQNARAIGEAAARGDLSENAEWTAALEERDRLTERAKRLEADLKKARLIPTDFSTTEYVTIGSSVRVHDKNTGKIETLIFLGPWDAEFEKGICSYRSPIGMAFMGKRVGDTVTMTIDGHEKRWEILEIG